MMNAAKGPLALCTLVLTLGALACGSPGGEPIAPGGGGHNGGGGAVGGTGGRGGGAGGGGGASGGSTGATGGVSGNGGTGASGGSGGAGGGGAPGNGGASDSGGQGSDAGPSPGGDAAGLPKFSFFMASQKGLFALSGNPKGFGGDLRFGKLDGLSGADEICAQLAEKSMPGARAKQWRAFLSVTKGPEGNPVNAIDRVGQGPWYDRRGRLVSMTKAGLQMTRPQGADPVIAQDLPNEEGVPNHNPDGTGIIDNHNTLTGSTAQGMLHAAGLRATCQDWTSSSPQGGQPRCGVSWPRGGLTSWISALNEGGCAPGATPPGAEQGPSGTVGALGGYGGFYCFALTP